MGEWCRGPAALVRRSATSIGDASPPKVRVSPSAEAHRVRRARTYATPKAGGVLEIRAAGPNNREKAHDTRPAPARARRAPTRRDPAQTAAPGPRRPPLQAREVGTVECVASSEVERSAGDGPRRHDSRSRAVEVEAHRTSVSGCERGRAAHGGRGCPPPSRSGGRPPRRSGAAVCAVFFAAGWGPRRARPSRRIPVGDRKRPLRGEAAAGAVFSRGPPARAVRVRGCEWTSRAFGRKFIPPRLLFPLTRYLDHAGRHETRCDV